MNLVYCNALILFSVSPLLMRRLLSTQVYLNCDVV